MISFQWNGSGSDDAALCILKIDRLDFVVQGVANIHEVDASADRLSDQRRQLAVEIGQIEWLRLWLVGLKQHYFGPSVFRFGFRAGQRCGSPDVHNVTLAGSFGIGADATKVRLRGERPRHAANRLSIGNLTTALSAGKPSTG
jgi:hypothetical protein